MEKLKNTIFYSLEKTIKSYRQFAQRNIKNENIDITIDQWLVLKTLQENPEISQKELADQVFKDYASVTRIIELLVNRKYLERKTHPSDRRRFKLELTAQAHEQFSILFRIVDQNRSTALKGIGTDDITHLHNILQKIISNILTI